MKNQPVLLWLTVAAAALGACSSIHDQPSLDALTAVKGQNAAGLPYVEAYFEYVGPHAKWAGPTSWVLHIDAREGEWARVKTQPAFAGEDDTARKPAAQAEGSGGGLSIQAARAQFMDLASLMSPDRRPQSAIQEACLSPVRVRLVRQDGAVLDQQGCRSAAGWEGKVSKATAFFMDAISRAAPSQP